MTLPAQLSAVLEQTLGAGITHAGSVSGGCISKTARLDLANGRRAFLKWAHAHEHTAGLFRAEARSLQSIAETRTVRVPEVIHVFDEDGTCSFLLLEWLEPGVATSSSWRALGSSLANLHRCRGESFGWDEGNFIGSLPQSNRLHKKWSDFWRLERITPQLDMAHARFGARDLVRIEKLLDASDELLAAGDAEGASLLHGDLWNGNVHMMTAGDAAVIDPSSYYGHREVDLAMSKLFGGFAREFYDGYQQTWPMTHGAEQRMLMYQLYYLLVHVNLFGASYVPNTLAVVKQLGF